MGTGDYHPTSFVATAGTDAVKLHMSGPRIRQVQRELKEGKNCKAVTQAGAQREERNKGQQEIKGSKKSKAAGAAKETSPLRDSNP